MNKTPFCAVLIAAALTPLMAQDHASEERMQWWSAQKFGMFIHYGPWSHNNDRDYKDGNWTATMRTREEAIRTFNPVPDAAEQWATLAKEAGMKYMVFTTKHTSGFDFPMWATKTTNYGITFPDCPYRKQPNPDFVDGYVKAARKAGMGVGLYYPWDDKNHPDGDWFDGTPDFVKKYPERWARYVKFNQDQFRELCSQYGPIDIFWFDGGYQDRAQDAIPLLKMMRELQPGLILNNRGTQQMSDISQTPESFITRTGSSGYWETCMGVAGPGGWIPIANGGDHEYMTIGHGWYDYQGPKMEYKNARELVQALCNVASKGGNFLLGVGPKPDGTIPEKEVALLKEVGAWLKVNGEAIYGTFRSPLGAQPDWGRITRKGDTLYLLVFDWPERSGLLPLDIVGEIKNAKLLATGEPVKFRRKSKTSMELTLPQVPGAWDPNMHAVRRAPSDHVSVIVVQTDGNPTGLAKHPIIGTWTYQHAGKSYTREFTKDGTCLMKDGDAVGWTKAFCVVDDHTVLVEGGLTHVLTDQNSLNIESTFAGMRKAN